MDDNNVIDLSPRLSDTSDNHRQLRRKMTEMLQRLRPNWAMGNMAKLMLILRGEAGSGASNKKMTQLIINIPG